MRIFVRVKPNAKREGVERVDDAHYIVRANAPAKEGRANKRVEGLLADHFGVSRMSIWLVSGASSREKTFEIR